MNILFSEKNDNNYFNMNSLKINNSDKNNNEQIEIPVYNNNLDEQENKKEQVEIFKKSNNSTSSSSNLSNLSNSSNSSNSSNDSKSKCKITKEYTPCDITNLLNNSNESNNYFINSIKNVIDNIENDESFNFNCNCNYSLTNSSYVNLDNNNLTTSTVLNNSLNYSNSSDSTGSTSSTSSSNPVDSDDSDNSTILTDSTYLSEPSTNTNTNTNLNFSTDYMVKFLSNKQDSSKSFLHKNKKNCFKKLKNKTKKINICIDIEELSSDLTINIGKKLTINM